MRYFATVGTKTWCSSHATEPRHTCASLLLANGESVNVVAEQLGHDPAMTLRVYAHALPGAQSQAVNRLEAMLAAHGTGVS
jgi:integrase